MKEHLSKEMEVIKEPKGNYGTKIYNDQNKKLNGRQNSTVELTEDRISELQDRSIESAALNSSVSSRKTRRKLAWCWEGQNHQMFLVTAVRAGPVSVS